LATRGKHAVPASSIFPTDWCNHMKILYLILSFVAAASFGQAQSKAPLPKQPTAAPTPNFSGKVTETMNTAGYTYVLLDTGKQKVWIAAIEFAVKKGDTVAVTGGMPMSNYHSKTLDRDFDLVYFAADVQVNGKKNADAAELPAGHPPIAAPKSNLPTGHPPLNGESPTEKTTPIQKAANGQTVAEIHAAKAKLKGKPIAVRGKVVKYNAGILGKNWLHIQDGTGKSGTDSLVITTDSSVKVGNTVLVHGNVSVDRDFGGGYKYGVIVENAKVTAE
jgi:hypothetical protein